MTPQQKEKILQRPEYSGLLNIEQSYNWNGERIFITGAKGSIGTRLVERLKAVGADFFATDIDRCDITKDDLYELQWYTPTIVINLAGAKHAPEGEVNTTETLNINTNGVINIINALESAKINAHIVQASTCKSCNPETLYGATKLISERIVMNYGGSVARFFNVIETSGNVFEIWKEQNPIDVSIGCTRHYITLDEAVGLTIFACFNKGRFIVNSSATLATEQLAEIIYPEKRKNYMDRRRGDRANEPMKSTSETIKAEYANGAILQLESNHD